MPVTTITLSTLPYDLSASNFNNSPSRYENSPSKFENSNGCFENSPSKFDNSPSRYENLNGTHRLLLNGRVVGYFVVTQHGVTNFFSKKGTRLFYNPKQGSGVFDAADGSFVGVVRRERGVLSLCLGEPALQKLSASP